MKSFNLFDQPLRGAHLIEAGAGTGKTYTLAALFLRLVVEQGIRIDQILVVTYTTAATEELKTRIRQRLLSAKKGWYDDKVDDPLLAELRRRKTPSSLAMQRLQDALIDFDRAAIYTIHGFCQRLLQYFAFETGHLFQSELVQDDDGFFQEAAEDFWRRYITRAPKELAVQALKKLHGPSQLARTLQRSRLPNIVLSPKDQKPILSAILPWRNAARAVRDQWPQVRNRVKQLLQYDGLNARNYGACKIKNGDHGPTPRQIKVEVLCREMDQWGGDYPVFKKFELFSSHRIALATNKGKITPEHPFFELCQIALKRHDLLIAQLDAYLGYLKVRLCHRAGPAIADQKKRHNVLFFDDLLLFVHRAVKGRHGRALVEAIQSQYQAALVDEFQDTDQLQYEIFFTLFAQGQNLLTMIGDPKQAIYSFRGADLFSYIEAAGAAHSRTTLTRNWRATPELIKALNTVFSNHPKPFGFNQIGFQHAVAATKAQSKLSPAMQLWYLPTDDKEMPKGGMPAADTVYDIARAVATEIVGLLDRPENSFVPEDIAVLVRTHHQAHIVKQALSQKKVPAVLHSAGRIFDTPQAEALERVLAAVALPTDHALVRAALASSLFGWDASHFLSSLENGGQRWQTQWDHFWNYHQVWVRHGFYAMFRHMMDRERIKKRVLGYPEGERSMTNLLHLAELLHQAEMAQGLGPDGLIKWLAFKRRSQNMDSDDQQLRLESDSRAVRIITMHKSKGLQFEVVFCPYTWAGLRDDGQAALLHDPNNGHRLTLALGPLIPDAFKRQSRKEALAENLRMLYVALTRARQRCYWMWGRIKGAEASAPAYLLHGHDIDMDVAGWDKQLKEKMIGMDHARWVAALSALARDSGGSIGVTTMPTDNRRLYSPSQALSGPLVGRTLKRRLDHDWRIASFSSLTAGDAGHVERSTVGHADAQADLSALDSSNALTLFDFPKGARAGLFFHDVLEHWNHTHTDTHQHEDLVDEKLRKHGYKAEWAAVINQMLVTLSHTRLTGATGRFSLSQVSLRSRINEMAFYFPLKAIKARQIQLLFQNYVGRSVSQEMADTMGRLSFAPVRGFMKGYIDMIFSHDGRYYLLDWKSNHLGAGYDHYTAGRLEEAMAQSYYFLQYHLYAVALDQWLQRRLNNYDYKKDFGGVYYIFLRGLNPKMSGSGSSGIFYNRPDSQLMKALSRLLIANP